MKKGWQTKRIGELCEVVAGQSPEGKFYNSAGKGLPFYQGKKDFGEKFIEAPTTWTTQTTKIAKAGDILMSVRAPVGPVNFSTEEICIGRGLAAIRCGTQLNRDFLFYQLLHLQPEIAGKEGAVFASINKSEIEALPLAFAPLAEQQRIVGVLDEAFAGLATAQAHAAQNLQNARALFESHLQSVFTRRGAGWVERRLGDLIEIQNGYAFKSDDYTDEGYFVIRIGNVQDGEITLDNPRFIKLADKKLERFVLNKGDILVSLTGNIGRVGIIQDEHLPAVLNQRVARITRTRAEADREFVFRFLCSRAFRQELQEAGHGAAQQNVSTKEIQSVAISLPELREQRQIAIQLDALAAETQRLARLYEQKQAALAALKRSLLHQAFNGEL